MTWSAAQRRVSREKYNRLYRSPHKATFEQINIPDDIQRVDVSEPCFPCGIARGPCRHRPWIEAVNG